jgi:hypothetical protein
VYVANLGLYAFDVKGKALWSAAQEAMPIYLDFGTGSSPALAGDLLVIVNDNEKHPPLLGPGMIPEPASAFLLRLSCGAVCVTGRTHGRWIGYSSGAMGRMGCWL